MKINIIYDSRRFEKYEPLIKELEGQKAEYEIWPCIIQNDVPSSINASHKMIVRMAKEQGLKEVCIGEDDLMFTAKDSWQFFLKNKPDVYDLYLSSTYVLPISNNIVCGFHLYLVSERFYDKFLSVPDNSHIDTAMNDINGNYHFCYPFAAIQRAGFSANNMAVCNYNTILKPEDIYQ